MLEFYDFEAALAGPSVTGPERLPVAFPSLYDLLSAPQTRALARKGASQWYLFDPAKTVVGGPAIRTSRKGWTTLAVPKNTVVVSCDVAAGNCLSSRQITGKKGFYLFRHSDDPSDPVPEMTGRDLKLSRTRADVDPQTNQPVVLMQFTRRGQRIFHEITRREAQRGALICAGRRDFGDVQQCAQHFALVLDREIQTVPYIDFLRNPMAFPATSACRSTSAHADRSRRLSGWHSCPKPEPCLSMSSGCPRSHAVGGAPRRSLARSAVPIPRATRQGAARGPPRW